VFNPPTSTWGGSATPRGGCFVIPFSFVFLFSFFKF
jgi:hypothetical protein